MGFCSVYVLEDSSDGVCKIGIAKSAKDRVKTLQTSNPRWRLTYSSPLFPRSTARVIEKSSLDSLRAKYGSVHLESGRESELIYCTSHDATKEVLKFIKQRGISLDSLDFVILKARARLSGHEINPVLINDGVIKLNQDFELHQGNRDQDGNYYEWDLVYVPEMENGIARYKDPIFNLKKFREAYPLKPIENVGLNEDNNRKETRLEIISPLKEYLSSDLCDKCGYVGVSHVNNKKVKICEICWRESTIWRLESKLLSTLTEKKNLTTLCDELSL